MRTPAAQNRYLARIPRRPRMDREQVMALVFLGYLLVPVLFLFVWWLVGWVRRKLSKKGEDLGESRESES